MSHERKGEPFRIEDSLRHMIESIDAVRQFLEGFTRETLADDERTIFAIRAAFITLGEACGRLPRPYRDSHAHVPWAKIRHFRNFMIHVYDKIDVEPLWDTAQNDLPSLRDQLVELLDDQRRS